MRALLTALIGIGAIAAPVAQDPVYFPPTDRVAVRVMSEVPPVEPVPGVQLRTVIGATGSMSVCEYAAGSSTPVHHHTREQVDVGITGALDIRLGTHVEKVGPGAGVIVPPDVEHLIANHGRAPMTVIEFHPVRRPDLVPPRPVINFAQSPEPVSIPDGRSLVVRLDRGIAGTPADIRGETCTLTWLQISRRGTPIEIHPSAVEMFVYVVRGDLDLTLLPPPQRVHAGSLILVPAGQLLRLEAVGTSDAAIVEFSPARESQRRLALQPCDVPGLAGGGRCGTYEVYENRTTKTGRTIALNVVVIPAGSGTPAPDPIFWLEGGPGGAATSAIGPVVQKYLAGLRRDHDIVFVDQRGAGKSNPLQCGDIGEDPANLDGYFGKIFPPAEIRACRQALEKIADLTQYTTSVAMDDLDEVRAALGYDRINLAGASYGTLAAQVYIRQHPDHVRSAFLVGIVTPDFRLPLPFARAAGNALDRMYDDCDADQACHTAFPRLRDEFNAVLARFDRGPVVVAMTDPSTKQSRSVTLERESYVEHLRIMLYSTAGARFVPVIVHQAFEGNFLPFQTMASRYTMGGLARGMYFSVTCAEDAPFITEQDIISDTRGTFLGDRRVRAHLSACAEWPKAPVPRSFLDPLKSDVPIVLFAGDADGSTPPWIAEEASRSLANGHLIRAPHTGHQIDGPCTFDLMTAFITNPSAHLDPACVASARRPSFAIDIPR